MYMHNITILQLKLNTKTLWKYAYISKKILAPLCIVSIRKTEITFQELFPFKCQARNWSLLCHIRVLLINNSNFWKIEKKYLMICTKVNMCSSKANNVWFIETEVYHVWVLRIYCMVILWGAILIRAKTLHLKLYTCMLIIFYALIMR